MSDLLTFVEPISGFTRKPDSYKIQVFGWFLHTARQKDRFTPAELSACFDEVHVSRPSNIHRDLARLVAAKPAALLKDSRGYRLSAHARDQLNVQLPSRATAVSTASLLNGAADRISDPIKKQFLHETLICFKYRAYRAAIVMAWNLAYSDVLDRILATDLARFNAQLPKVLPKAAPINRRSDFEDHKESKILEVARGAGDLSASSYKILAEKLGKRNLAAHPSNITIESVQAEEVITDLMQNIVLRATL